MRSGNTPDNTDVENLAWAIFALTMTPIKLGEFICSGRVQRSAQRLDSIGFHSASGDPPPKAGGPAWWPTRDSQQTLVISSTCFEVNSLSHRFHQKDFGRPDPMFYNITVYSLKNLEEL